MKCLKGTYFNELRENLEYQSGNMVLNASRILYTGGNCHFENLCLVFELMHLYSKTFVEVERKNWTKWENKYRFLAINYTSYV